ncbi:alpha/beta fold hydrolase [Klenkia soli]|uniref:alpha/beta fold hydrolase n=1 Tax=Klenkia soli TaxID=1052260 RepID=UPI000B82EF15|nr:alpha/beta hydrolase [Klenkia soli]
MDPLRRNAVTVTGSPDGVPVVFVHGFGCDQGMWRHVAPAFEATHPVVTLDHVGAGGSDTSGYDRERYSSLQAYADDLVEVLAASGLPPVVLVGHSVSATIGALAAIARPEVVRQLVMVAPNPRFVDDDGYRGGFGADEVDELLETMEGNHLGWSADIAPVIMGAPDRPELGEELTRSFCRTDPTIARDFARVTFLSDHRADLAHVPVPTLVLQCSDDALAPLEVGAFVHDQLPDSELVVLAATGHCPNLSAPAELVGVLRAHLDRG